MRDLEIRGAGNLLGAEQSGHIAAVGFDLYMEMVTEAVGELTGEVRDAPDEVQIDLPITAHLPRDYITRDDVRMEAYRRLAAVTNIADVEDVRAEWIDRYGPPPKPAVALLDVARLRAEALRLGIRAVSVQKKQARFDGLELRKSQEARLKQIAPEVACPARRGRGSGRDRETRASSSKDCSRLLALIAPRANGAGTIRVVIHRTFGRLVALVVARRSSHERLLQHPARRGNGHVRPTTTTETTVNIRRERLRPAGQGSLGERADHAVRRAERDRGDARGHGRRRPVRALADDAAQLGRGRRRVRSA